MVRMDASLKKINFVKLPAVRMQKILGTAFPAQNSPVRPLSWAQSVLGTASTYLVSCHRSRKFYVMEGNKI